jgi:L-lactate utilization protein LutB
VKGNCCLPHRSIAIKTGAHEPNLKKEASLADHSKDQSKMLHDWFYHSRVEKTMKALEKNGFKASFEADAESATKKILSEIPDGSTVGIGGSITLYQIGFLEQIQTHNVQVVDPKAPGKEKQHFELSRQLFSCDYFISGTNAVTEEGHLYNVDATGNRVGPMIFGPGRTIIACGVNKIVKDMAEARSRVWNIAAPMNARRKGKKTPCAETGFCSDCNAPERICNISVELVKKPRKSDIHIIFIGETLGL